MNDVLGDLVFVIGTVILAITILPLLLGVVIGSFLNYTGPMFYIVVLLVASIIWGFLTVFWWLW